MGSFSTLFAEPEFDAKVVPGFLRDAMEQRKKDNSAKLVQVGAALLEAVAAGRQSRLTTLRQARAVEKQCQANLKAFERAAIYFEHTGNFGPLSDYLPPSQVFHFCRMLGVDVPTNAEKEIPTEWLPPS